MYYVKLVSANSCPLIRTYVSANIQFRELIICNYFVAGGCLYFYSVCHQVCRMVALPTVPPQYLATSTAWCLYVSERPS